MMSSRGRESGSGGRGCVNRTIESSRRCVLDMISFGVCHSGVPSLVKPCAAIVVDRRESVKFWQSILRIELKQKTGSLIWKRMAF